MKKIHIILSLSVLLFTLIFTGSLVYADNSEEGSYQVIFDGAGGTINGEATYSISSPKEGFSQFNVNDYVPKKDGFTFTGWYNGSKRVTRIVASSYTDGSSSINLVATYSKNDYSGSGLTFTLDANGGTIGGASSATYDFEVSDNKYAISLSSYVPNKDGYKLASWNTAADGSGADVDLLYADTYTSAGDNGYSFTDVDGNPDKRNITFYARWTEAVPPTGTITIESSSWSSITESGTFDTFYKKAVTAYITAPDDVSIEYLISDSAIDGGALSGAGFNSYVGALTIDSDGAYIVYAKLTDTITKMTAYISSEGFTVDTLAPAIEGINDKRIHCGEVTVTIKETNLDKVTIDGSEASLNENKQFTLSPSDDAQTIKVTDKAGHVTELSVTIYKEHAPVKDDSDCTTDLKCKNCGEVLVSSNTAHTFSQWESTGNDTHSRHCTNKGCGFKVTQDCHGGTATCIKKAVCKVCGEKYGDYSSTNHKHLKKTDYVAASAAKEGNIDYWHCSDCNKYFSNSSCTKEISRAKTIISKTKPTIIGGKDTKWKRSQKDSLKFRSDAAFEDFICVLVDGNQLSSSDYTKYEGSIIVEIKASYLENLSVGYHTVTIRSKSGDAVANFTIEAKDKPTTQATTQATTESTTEHVTTRENTYDRTTEDDTTEEQTEVTTKTNTTTEVTTEKSTLDIEKYNAGDSIDKRKDRVHNLKIIIIITIVVTILGSFAIILISSGLKKNDDDYDE